MKRAGPGQADASSVNNESGLPRATKSPFNGGVE